MADMIFKIRHHLTWMKVLLAFLVLLPALTLAETPKLNLKCEHYSTGEVRKKQQIERLAQKYDLTKYTITAEILIEERVINHSLPTLTLNLMFLDNDDLALGVLVHEQAHRLLHDRNPGKAQKMLPELKGMYPHLKFDSWGADDDERAAYIHLPVIMLEWQALEDLIGVERAGKVMKSGRLPNHKLFATVVDNRKQMEELLKQFEVKW